MSKRKSGFKTGSGCFTCRICYERTRDTNGGNGSIDLCPLCYAKCGCDNSLNDAGFKGDSAAVFADCQTPDECETLLAFALETLKRIPGLTNAGLKYQLAQQPGPLWKLVEAGAATLR